MVGAHPFASEISRRERLELAVAVQTFPRFTVSGQKCRYRPRTRMNARELPRN